MPLNVLQLISGRGPTGAAAAAISDARALLAAGHTAYVAARDGGAVMAACAEAGVPCVGGLKLGRGAMRILHFPHDIRRLRALAREFALDVIHVHRSDDQLLAAAALGRTLSALLVRTWHRDPKGVPRPLLARLARQTDACVCVSREHAATLQAAGAPRAEFIQVGVDTENLTPQPPSLRGKREPWRIGHVGRWKRDRAGNDRGQRAALDVFTRLPRELAWKGMLIGRGEMAADLQREAYTERKLARERVELVHFEKHAPREFAALLASLQLGLVFTTGGDGTSRAGAELLACGVPLVVADLPGLRELAEDGACAARQLPADPAGWASFIAKLLAEPARLAEMGRAARIRAEGAHSLKARGEALAKIYKSE